MAKRIKFVCEHGVTVNFIAETLSEIGELTGLLNDSSRESSPYVHFHDALGNDVAVCAPKVIAILMERLSEEEEEELLFRQGTA